MVSDRYLETTINKGVRRESRDMVWLCCRLLSVGVSGCRRCVASADRWYRGKSQDGMGRLYVGDNQQGCQSRIERYGLVALATFVSWCVWVSV